MHRAAIPVGGVLWTADFTTLATGGGITLPNSLLIARASDGHSVQTGASTVALVTAGNDTARVGQRDGAGTRGGLIEPARTNYLLSARDPLGTGWLAGIHVHTNNAANGPDGAALADLFDADAGEYGYYQSPATLAAVPHTLSSWNRRETGAGAGEYQTHWYSTTEEKAVYGALGETWQRTKVSVTTTSTSTGIAPCDARDLSAYGGRTATALKYLYDMCQIEAGKFPTEWIATAGASVTRAAERLYLASCTPLMSGTRLNLTLQFIPKAVLADLDEDPYLVKFDANNYARIIRSTGRLEVYVGGVSYSPVTVIAWAAHDVVVFSLSFGGGVLNTVASYTLNGGAPISIGTSGSPQAALPTTGAIDFCCNGTANHLTSWVQKIEAAA